MGDERAKHLDQLRQAYESGILDEETYQITLAALDATSNVQTELSNSDVVNLGSVQTVGDQGVVGSQAREDIITGDNNTVNRILNVYLEQGGQQPDQETLRCQIADYLVWMQSRYGVIELRGIKRRGRQVVQLDLQAVYVPLEAEIYRLSRWERVELDQVLSLDQYIVITGGPGSGKTTVLQHLAWTLTEAIVTDTPTLALEKLGLRGETPLPIFIPLSTYALHLSQLPASAPPQEKTLAAFITRYLIEKQTSFELPLDFFQQLLRNGQAVILLLDGMDEVSNEEERAQVREAIEDLVTGRDKMWVVVTCRSVAYKNRTTLGKGFKEVQVRPLSEVHIIDLVGQAYHYLYYDDPRARQNKTDQLLKAITKLEAERRRRFGHDVEPLVSTPLMVRLLLVVHYSERHLPAQRVELYMKATDAMLLPEYTLDEAVANRLGSLVGGRWEIHRELVQYLAFAMHQRGEAQGREITELELRQILSRHPTYAKLADDFIALTRLRGTLLEERLGTYRFIHLAFQEFLAARYLAEIIRTEAGVEGIASFLKNQPSFGNWWREPTLLVFGYLSVTTPQIAQMLPSCLARLDNKASQENQGISAEVAVMVAEAAGTAALEWPDTPENLSVELAELLANLFQLPDLHSQVSLDLKNTIGSVLARLGDPRPGVGLRPDGLPGICWSQVPAGSFLMGSDKEKDRQAENSEFPQHKVFLPGYTISRYPITNKQYEVFVEDGGYTEKWRHCWTEAGWRWKSERRGPRSYDETFDLLNHPVVGVTWYEAIAFCAWLTVQLQSKGELDPTEVITLPSERQWEKAARGATGLIYPWGNKADPNRVNCDETGIGATTTVGIFPDGASPYECEEMSGNIWEWCRTKWHNDYQDYRDDNGLEGVAGRVVRGGAFYFNQSLVRCVSRRRFFPATASKFNGFRVIICSAS